MSMIKIAALMAIKYAAISITMMVSVFKRATYSKKVDEISVTIE